MQEFQVPIVSDFLLCCDGQKKAKIYSLNQYFQSIEQSGANTRTQGPPLVSRTTLYTPVTAPEIVRAKQTQNLKFDTAFERATEDAEELTPDNMSSRLVDSAVAGVDHAVMQGDLVFDQMGSRITKGSLK